MGLTIEMVMTLHKRSLNKVNLIYKKGPKGNKIGYCYIDPKHQLRFLLKDSRSYPRWLTPDILDLLEPTLLEDIKVSVYKQDTNMEIFVKPEDVDFQNQNKAEMLKLIYGTT